MLRAWVNDSAKGSILCDQTAESLAGAIEEFAKLSEQEKEKLGRNNQAYYRSHFSQEYVGSAVNEELLNELR